MIKTILFETDGRFKSIEGASKSRINGLANQILSEINNGTEFIKIKTYCEIDGTESCCLLPTDDEMLHKFVGMAMLMNSEHPEGAGCDETLALNLNSIIVTGLDSYPRTLKHISTTITPIESDEGKKLMDLVDKYNTGRDESFINLFLKALSIYIDNINPERMGYFNYNKSNKYV